MFLKWVVRTLSCVAILALAVSAPARDAAGDALAKKVIDAYRAMDTYQAKWVVEPLKDGKVNEEQSKLGSSEIEVCFDRASGRVVFEVRDWKSGADGAKALAGVQLVVVEKQRIQKAVSPGGGRPMIESEQAFESVTYRDVRRSLVIMYPFDLAALMSDAPLAEWLQGRPSSVTAMPDETKDRIRFVVADETGETKAIVAIDSATHLIQEAQWAKAPFRYRLLEMKKDEALADGAFDFRKRLEAIKQLTDK